MRENAWLLCWITYLLLIQFIIFCPQICFIYVLFPVAPVVVGRFCLGMESISNSVCVANVFSQIDLHKDYLSRGQLRYHGFLNIQRMGMFLSFSLFVSCVLRMQKQIVWRVFLGQKNWWMFLWIEVIALKFGCKTQTLVSQQVRTHGVSFRRSFDIPLCRIMISISRRQFYGVFKFAVLFNQHFQLLARIWIDRFFCMSMQTDCSYLTLTLVGIFFRTKSLVPCLRMCDGSRGWWLAA